MKKYTQNYVVACNIQKVWDFYTDVKHLELLSPENIQESVITSTHARLEKNSEIWTSTRLFFKQIWHSKITEFEPYSYTDELQEGLLKKWKHVHKFEKLSDNQTSITDEIIFELPYGIFGKFLEVFVLNKLRDFFEHRKKMTLKILETHD